VWFDLPEEADEQEIVRGLKERDIIVRSGGALGRPGALRVSFGPHSHNQRFLDVLEELL
jgi:histidinol-phosphate aminotransferase